MFSKIRSLIFKLDPEKAHDLAIKALKFNLVSLNKIKNKRNFGVLNKFLKSEEEIINKKIDKMVNNIELIFSDIPLFLTKVSDQS